MKQAEENLPGRKARTGNCVMPAMICSKAVLLVRDLNSESPHKVVAEGAQPVLFVAIDTAMPPHEL